MNELDQGAINLAKAIRETESHGNWNAKGASGEWGAYQWTPATWTSHAREAGVNAAFGAATPDQQNEVAYKTIKKWKDQGYNVGQIASMWNAGQGRPNAYIEGNKGVNSQGVSYDTGAYAEKVAKAYQRLKGQTMPTKQQVSPVKEDEKTLGQDLTSSMAKSGTRIASAVGDTFSGKINPLSGLIQLAGGVAGGIGDVTGDLLRHTPLVGDLLKGVEGLVGTGVEKVANTELGRSALQGYSEFAQKHPELAANLVSGVDIATAVPILKGVGAAKNAVAGGIKTALKGSTDDVLETVSAKLGPKKLAQAIQTRGTEKKGILREVHLKPDPYEVKIADAVKANVPKFNSSKPLLYNIDQTQKVVTKMKDALKKKVITDGADRIYSFKELSKTLKDIERPLLISGDTTLNKVYDRVIAKAMEIAKKKGGKVSNLLDVRQDFDAFIKRQFPNLYSSDTLTPIRQAVKDIREAINDFTAKNLPDGPGFRESLLTQHQLIKAIENMAGKAATGMTKEVGTNAITRFGDRHPIVKGLLKTGGQAAIQGVGAGGVIKVLD